MFFINKYKFISILFCLVFIISCKSGSKLGDNNSVIGNSSETILSEPQIAFLGFTMKRDSSENKNGVSLIEKRILKGNMKKENPSMPYTKQYLTIDLYEDGILKHTFYAEHPLYKAMEYPTTDGRLETKLVELDESDFYIRIPLEKLHTYIQISETLMDESKTLLLKLDIN